ncbi:fungal-specific transcription factor domain-containing protein [Tirmania nivea]|nr:fungal-specific transcription factor domain-containing protein [Tirmania nivea]
MADRRPNLAPFATADPLARTIPSSGGRSLSIPNSSFALRTSGPSNAALASLGVRSGGSNTSAESPPTTDCFQCKKRRIACDRGFPTCQKCAKKGLPCPGYKKPKIVWKVLKINQVPEARKFFEIKSEGETQTSKSTRPSVPPTRRTHIRNRTKAPLIDVGFAFKVEPTAQQTSNPTSLGPNSQKQSTPSEGEKIETIPRYSDPYEAIFGVYSAACIRDDHSRICIAIEYFKPLRPGPNGLLAPSSKNPLGALIAEGLSSPLLLNCMLSIAARHRVIIINTEAYTDVRREYDAGRVFTCALTYHGCAVRLLRERVSQHNYFDNPTAGRICEDSEMATAGIGMGKVSFPLTKQLWEDDSMMMVIILLIYYDIIDGGQGDGNWRNHLEIGKWVIEQREARGLGMGVRGSDWGFIREHMETLEAIGSSFTPSWRIPSQQIWLRPRPGEQPVYDACPPSPITPSGTHNWQKTTYAQSNPPRSIDDIINAPEYVTDYPLLLIPRGLWRCMHQIATLRREYAFLKSGNGNASMSIQEICNAHEYVLACISAFNPSKWPTPPLPETVSQIEFLAVGALYQLSLHVYLHMSVTMPLSKSPLAASYNITSQPPAPLTPRTSPTPDPSGSEHSGSPPPNMSTTHKNSTAELLSTLCSSLAIHLQMISCTSPAFRSAVWPCMCAGIAAQTVQQIVFVRRYMGFLVRAMPCIGVLRGYEALERLWTKRAKEGRARRAGMGTSRPEGLAEEEWDEILEGYEGSIEDWEAAVDSFEGDWLVI